MLIKALVVVFLLYLLYQDIRYRSVYWISFPVLLFLMITLGFQNLKAVDLFHNSLVNSGFLLIQLFILTVWFSIKQGSIVNITHSLIGWGDVLFLLSITCYLSPLNYLAFYMISLLVILSLILVFAGSEKKGLKVPLAGFQSLLLIVFLITDWTSNRVNLSSDNWLLSRLNLWI